MRAVRGWALPLALTTSLCCWSFATSDRASRALGAVWPVVSVLEISNVTAEDVDGLPSSLISGKARKLRDCKYRGVTFYLGGPDGVPIEAKFLDKPQEREVGELFWSGLLVGVTPDRLWEVYGEVTHWCSSIEVISPFFIGGTK